MIINKLFSTAFIGLLVIFCSHIFASESKIGSDNSTKTSVGHSASEPSKADSSAQTKKGKYKLDCSDPDLEMLGLAYMCTNRE